MSVTTISPTTAQRGSPNLAWRAIIYFSEGMAVGTPDQQLPVVEPNFAWIKQMIARSDGHLEVRRRPQARMDWLAHYVG
jgi:hypothetical protein